MSPHRCQVDGHVLVAGDPECLICRSVPVVDEPATVLGVRFDPELTDPRDLAQPPEWGNCGF